MNNKGLIRTITFIFLGALVLIDKFAPEGIWKSTGTVLAVIGSFYGIVKQLFPKSRFVKILDHHIRKYRIFSALIEPEKREDPVKSEPFSHFKRELLKFTNNEALIRSEFINSPDIFCYDFEVFRDFENHYQFNAGAETEDKSSDWKKNYKNQFYIITGDSGSGKSYELIKRVKFICNTLIDEFTRNGVNSLENIKIPVYIELRSLNQPLDLDWIVDYLMKTSEISDYDLTEEQIIKIINDRDVIFFFDGIDEVSDSYREECVKKIVEFTNTGVQATCRKHIYEDLLFNNIIEESSKPAELFLKPLNLDWIKKIISSLPNRSANDIAEMLSFISDNEILQDQLTRPIFLNLFMIGFPELSLIQKEKLAAGDLDVLWENYEDIISQKKLPKDYDILELRTNTVWIAKIMNQDSFFIESIQPNWLWKVTDKMIEKGEKREYTEIVTSAYMLQKLYFIFTRILASLIVGIAMGCIIATPFSLLADSIIGGLVISLMAGIYKHSSLKVESNWLTILKKGFFYVSMISVLIFVCGVFQGVSVPRNPAEMMTPFFSMAECWSGILLGICLSTIFSYRIVMEDGNKKYILPVETFHFDWKHAVLYGFFWGGATGMIAGSIALYVKHQFTTHIFIKDWLIPYLDTMVRNINGHALAEKNQDIAIFIYAFVVAFSVSAIIISLMAGRFNDKDEVAKEKQELNFGIIKSASFAVKHGMIVGGLCSVIYGLFVIFGKFGDWYFCFKISAGIFLLALLWFGGMEVINHWLLRINLYIRGISPINYGPWVQDLQRMGMIVPTGYQLKFFHPTLAHYYINYSTNKNPRIRLRKKISLDTWIYTIILLLLSFTLLTPLLRRYVWNSFWTSPYDIEISAKEITKKGEHDYIVQKSGIYKVATSGRSNVGTFVGYVWPEGTKFGFMGMPIKSVYNIPGFEKYRHAALLYRTKSDSMMNWSNYYYVSETDSIRLNKNDELEFLVNDKEWQNNLGKYKVELVNISN